MAKKKEKQTFTIDGKEYSLDNLSEEGRSQINNIQYVDGQIVKLNNQLAVSDTAKNAYLNALRNDLKK
jgi:hypothetical protein